ncbi:hypothetical protein TPAR_07163 [Tolypocladium paradoxum]|uniref:Uncharacterized protein n=1 Tax=Tolypocladium paradoxum TaxID=94208 RepID=A0A2S4KR64_9HYPO|nr:hypothetical protein TPAR_07163 [Tolypocladium paradoxum]
MDEWPFNLQTVAWSVYEPMITATDLLQQSAARSIRDRGKQRQLQGWSPAPCLAERAVQAMPASERSSFLPEMGFPGRLKLKSCMYFSFVEAGGRELRCRSCVCPWLGDKCWNPKIVTEN